METLREGINELAINHMIDPDIYAELKKHQEFLDSIRILNPGELMQPGDMLYVYGVHKHTYTKQDLAKKWSLKKFDPNFMHPIYRKL